MLELVEYIERYVDKNEKLPTLADIGEGLGVNRNVVLYRAQNLKYYSYYEYKNKKIRLKDED